MNMSFQFIEYFLCHSKCIKFAKRCGHYVLHSIQGRCRYPLCIIYLSQTMFVQNPMILLGKEYLLSLHRLSFTAYTMKQRWTQSLRGHHAKFKDTTHQPVFNMWIQESLYCHIQKIHGFFLVRTLLAEIIRKLQKIISVIDSRLFSCQFYKVMSYGYLIQIITGTTFIKGKCSKYKRICSCQKLTVRTACSLCKCRYLSSLSCEKNDPLIIFSYRHGREHYSLHCYQITHSLCSLNTFYYF